MQWGKGKQPELRVSLGQVRAGNGTQKDKYLVTNIWDEIPGRKKWFIGIFLEKF